MKIKIPGPIENAAHQRTASKFKSVRPRKSADVPVTKKMLFRVRDELKHEIVSVRLEMNGKFKKVDARFAEIDSRFNKVDVAIADVKTDVAKVLSAVHRVGLLVEEQNARNIRAGMD